MTGAVSRTLLSGNESRIGSHNERGVRLLITHRIGNELTPVIGSKIVKKQRNGLLQGTRLISGSSGDANEVDSRSHQSLHTASGDLSVFCSPIPGTLQAQVPPDPTTENRFIILHGMTTWTAFLCIANLLELACGQQSGFNICALATTLPPAIAPTLKQQIVPHKPYVDMLPWSSLRDRMLNSTTAINELEFLQDMVSGDLKVWGVVPWDPMGWEVGQEFARKWWFLMDDGIIHAANFWRSQRGEKALELPQP